MGKHGITPKTFQDLTGNRYARLTVLHRVKNMGSNTRWLCLCDCGVEKEVNGVYLKNGQIRSCGCYNLEVLSKTKTTHGMSKTKLYRVWSGMVTRCYNKKRPGYYWYGGKGIKMSKEWRSDFMAFYNDMAATYKRYLELDRINVNGDYCKENCRWITHKENCRNKTNNILISHGDKVKCAKEWAEIYNLNYVGVAFRKKKGYSDFNTLFGKPKFDSQYMITGVKKSHE